MAVKKQRLVEADAILGRLTKDKLEVLNNLYVEKRIFDALLDLIREEIAIHKDKIYRLDVNNREKLAVDMSYYKGRVSTYVIIAHLLKNAGDELERRLRRE